MDMVIFDLETTGLSPTVDDIIQIAAVRIRAGRILPTDRFSTFINPGRPVPEFITSYTGISDAHVRHAPLPAKAIAQFSRFVGSDTLIAHNAHRFDMPFLNAACRKSGIKTRSAAYTDSILLSRKLWPSSRQHSLDAVLARLKIGKAGRKRHDARGDVDLLAEAIATMWDRLVPGCGKWPIPLLSGVIAA